MSGKILICDDEEGIRESLKLILCDHYDLVAVDSGEQALHTLANTKDIKVALLDIKMPKVNGLDVLQEIKSKYTFSIYGNSKDQSKAHSEIDRKLSTDYAYIYSN